MHSFAPENDVPREEPTADDVGTTCSALPRPLSAVVTDIRADQARDARRAPARPSLAHEASALAALRTNDSTANRPTSTRGQLRSAPTSTLLYDSRRGVHYEKPLLRGWLHLVWFEASLIAGTLLVVAAQGVTHRIGVTTYAGCLSGLFGVSALYHRGNWGPVASRMLQRADHAMIFLLIAGTATPMFLIAVPGTYGLVCLSILWSLTAVATGAHLTRMRAPERLVGGVFVGLGAANALVLPALWTNVGAAAAILVIAGGLLYVTGAVAYHCRRPDPFPSVFGYHEVFHAFVCAGATCHYVAIALLSG
jgi:hemolysin III